jgi:hypothetical protein
MAAIAPFAAGLIGEQSRFYEHDDGRVRRVRTFFM